MYVDHMDGSGWGLMVLWTFLLVALVVGVIWAIVGSGRRDQPPLSGGSPRSAREILDERLARGEVDPGEYDRLRERLDRSAPPRSPTPA